MYYITLFAISLIAFIIRVLLYQKQNLKRKIEALNLPSLKEHPLVGDSLKFIKLFGRAPGLPPSFYVLQAIEGLKQIFEGQGLFTISLGISRYVIFCSAQSVEVLLGDKNEVQKSPDYDFLKPLLGNGLITCGVENWRKHRKYLTPAFNFRLLEKSQEIMCEQSLILVENFKRAIGKEYVIIDDLLRSCTLDIIAESAFGMKFNTQTSSSSSQLLKAVNASEACVFERMISPWLWPEVLFSISKTGRKFNKLVKYLRSVGNQGIKAMKQQISENRKCLTAEEIVRESKMKNFIQLLLTYNLVKEDEPLSDEDILTEAITFFGTGYDSIGTTMGWIVYMLGLYPEVLAKGHEEMDVIFREDRDRTVTSTDLKDMVYLERVIKETLRLYPAAPIICRQLLSDLRVKDVLLPKGTSCVVMIGTVHRDPSVYPNPELFDPDRFLDSSQNPYAFIPFSAGPRNCIGMKYAMMELKTLLAYLLRTFKFTSLDPRDIVLGMPAITNHSSRPIRVKVELRTSDIFNNS